MGFGRAQLESDKFSHQDNRASVSGSRPASDAAKEPRWEELGKKDGIAECILERNPRKIVDHEDGGHTNVVA